MATVCWRCHGILVCLPFYLALPLATNIALVLFAEALVILGRTMYLLLYTYAMQQWNVIQQQRLANNVPEAMWPYVDPQTGTTVHAFMTADGNTFVRDHIHVSNGIYFARSDSLLNNKKFTVIVATSALST
jgi:hypothetical protein